MGVHGTDWQSTGSSRLAAALVEEAGRRSGLVWVTVEAPDVPGRRRPVWHVWRDGAAEIVCGGPEQPLPGVDRVTTAVVVTPAKFGHVRLVTWRARVTVLSPHSPEWDEAVPGLLAARLNLSDPDATREVWATDCVIVRLTPTGEVLEGPDRPPDGSLAEPPVPTPATTRGRLPWVIHSRQKSAPPLS